MLDDNQKIIDQLDRLIKNNTDQLPIYGEGKELPKMWIRGFIEGLEVAKKIASGENNG